MNFIESAELISEYFDGFLDVNDLSKLTVDEIKESNGITEISEDAYYNDDYDGDVFNFDEKYFVCRL